MKVSSPMPPRRLVAGAAACGVSHRTRNMNMTSRKTPAQADGAITESHKTKAAAIAAEFTEMCSLETIPMDQIEEGANVRRGKIKDAEVADLAQSIASVGLQQPIVVCASRDGKKGYRLICGHRRLAAHRLLGMTHIAALVHPHDDDEHIALVQAIENMQRRSLTPMEEADAARAAMEYKVEFGAAADFLGVSVTWIRERLSLFGLCDEAVDRLQDGTITVSHGIVLARAADHDDQRRALGHILPNEYRKHALSAHDTGAFLQQRMPALANAKWRLDAVIPGAKREVACVSCSLNTGNSPDLFGDGPVAKCGDSACYKTKQAIAAAAIKHNARMVVNGTVEWQTSDAIVPKEIIEAAAKDLKAKRDGKATSGEQQVAAASAESAKQEQLRSKYQETINNWHMGIDNQICRALRRADPAARLLADLITAETSAGTQTKLAAMLRRGLDSRTKAAWGELLYSAAAIASVIKSTQWSMGWPDTEARTVLACALIDGGMPEAPQPPEGLEVSAPIGSHRRTTKSPRAKATAGRSAKPKRTTKKGRGK